jgi:hypothetical protein
MLIFHPRGRKVMNIIHTLEQGRSDGSRGQKIGEFSISPRA